MNPLKVKSLSVRRFLVASSLVLTAGFATILVTGCNNQANNQFVSVQIASTDIKVTDKVPLRVMVNNPYGHQLEYRYTADRGEVVANNGISSTALYYAPFTGGPDTIRINVFDRNDNTNYPAISQNILVQGESMAYVELPNTGSTITNAENGLIKVASVRGAMNKKEIGWGRNPVISPDGRYVAYVTYPGDGSSQIIVKDAVGNETNITNNKSFNIDPSWSPIGKDGNLYLVFSSDRISSNSGNLSNGTMSGHGERYHLWRVHANGYDLRQITNTAGNDFQPSWSPDGSKIAFSSDLDNNKSNTFRNIWVLDVQTGKQTQYTHETVPNKGAYNPSWSADGQRIVYTRKYQKRQLTKLSDFQKIWMIDFTRNSEGFGQIVTREFDESITESYPSWSPDGRSISYVRNRGAENSVVSLDYSSIPRVGTNSSIGGGSYSEPMPEGDINNVTEATWARQRSYGYSYNNPNLNNPFTPGTGSSY